MNLNNSWVKGLIMILLTSLASILTTEFPKNGTEWGIFAITLIGTMAVYLAQSKWLPATSEQGQINGLDLLKALLTAVGNAVSTYVATLPSGTPLDWGALAKSASALFVGYLIKQLATPVPKQS